MVAHALAPIDIEVQIHSMEIEAYGAVLRALIAQSDALSWGKEELITDLRRELRVSDAEHREILTVVKSDDLIKKIRELRQVGTQPGQIANITNSFGYPSYSLSNMALKRPRTTTTVPVPTQFNAIGSRYEQGCRYVTIKIPRKGAEKPGFGTTNSDFDTIEILETNMLLDEIESVCGVEHPDPAMIAQAKSILKEHEKSLIEALNRLGDVPEDGY